jgi:hypothetical protein
VVSVFCRAEYTVFDDIDAETISVLAECTRRDGHDGHHCDRDQRRAWNDGGTLGPLSVDCPNGYEHGWPPNRAARRGNTFVNRSTSPASSPATREDYHDRGEAVTDTGLRCAVPDYSLPQFQPMTCGFPATFTATADDGSTVGVCKHCAPATVASGYVLTPVDLEAS